MSLAPDHGVSERGEDGQINVQPDAGGPADGTTACGQTGYPPCGGSVIGKNLANTYENTPLPANLSVPGAVYCATADCTGTNENILLAAQKTMLTTELNTANQILQSIPSQLNQVNELYSAITGFNQNPSG